MSTPIDASKGPRLPTASLTAGAGLLAMAVFAPAAYFYFIPQTMVSGDIAASIQNMRTNGSPYLIGLGLLFLTYCLDILVAWALFWMLRPGQEALSLLVAWMRLVYTALAFSSLLGKFSAYEFAITAPGETVDVQTLVYAGLGQSSSHEAVALLFFGVHLIFLSALIWRARHVPKWVAVPVLLAGAAYVTMNSMRFAAPSIDLGWVLILGLGEIVFMAWLLAFGYRRLVS